MAAQGRKNVHGKAGVRFKAAYTPSKNKSMLRNVATELIAHGEVKVPSGVTKELVSLADHQVPLAKKGDLASRRQAARVVRPIEVDDKGTTALEKLFSEIGPKFKTRQGGYTHVYKLGNRKGDNAAVTLVRWVD
jgi:large subunit ribosomal protein L17